MLAFIAFVIFIILGIWEPIIFMIGLFLLFTLLTFPIGWAFIVNAVKPFMRDSVLEPGLTSPFGRIYSAFIGIIVICVPIALFGEQFLSHSASSKRTIKQPVSSITRHEKVASHPIILTRYVASRGQQPFHISSCSSVTRILPSNMIFYETREEAISAGHRPCMICNP